MLRLTCLHKTTTHKLEIDASKGVPHLRAELHRLTGVEPSRQEIVGLSAGALAEDADLSLVNDGTFFMLISRGVSAWSRIPPPPWGEYPRCDQNRLWWHPF